MKEILNCQERTPASLPPAIFEYFKTELRNSLEVAAFDLRPNAMATLAYSES